MPEACGWRGDEGHEPGLACRERVTGQRAPLRLANVPSLAGRHAGGRCSAPRENEMINQTLPDQRNSREWWRAWKSGRRTP